ncbi:hypothetical protein DXT99_06855 [Pontibacter diazotrophicus]|uniref:FecR protein domain-containing protein n=1 Tax=Pontibacter diazotrophicus TaxID=1400979 RepID=A0A3D8LEM8_9BACT|nr:hypothetical protein [Pontibacter diazotrophicus]RDV15724.1 hypothetical protein DXT99_06855 [Pontibacter diazotrophicus]
MKRTGWCIVIFIFLSGGSFVQAQQTATTFRVKTGESPVKVIPVELQYRYPSFQKGKVVYMNGNFTSATFNYNNLLGEVQFITPKGDTMALAGEPSLVSVLVGESTYLHNQEEEFLEVVAEFNAVKLGKRQKLEFAGADKVGAYGQASGASSIRNTSTVIGSNSQSYSLEQKGDVVFSEKVAYFLIDERNQFHRVNKPSILKLFPKHRKQINAYLKEHSPDLSDEQDLKKLLQFCSTLAS